MTRSNIQRDVHSGGKRGTIPQNVYFETQADRIASLTRMVNNLPRDSSKRAILIETLRRDYDVAFIERVL